MSGFLPPQLGLFSRKQQEVNTPVTHYYIKTELYIYEQWEFT